MCMYFTSLFSLLFTLRVKGFFNRADLREFVLLGNRMGFSIFNYSPGTSAMFHRSECIVQPQPKLSNVVRLKSTMDEHYIVRYHRTIVRGLPPFVDVFAGESRKYSYD